MESILPPPPPFIFDNHLENVTSGNLSVEWTKWKEAFNIYFAACELSKKEEKVQINILLHIIGERAREVHQQFKSECTTLKSLIARFDKFFLPKKNLTIERHRFFTRSQHDSESIEQYAFELRKLAATCEFSGLMEDLIKDRLICGIKEDALRERLLREPDLTLGKCLDICNLAQMSKMQAGAIKQEAVEHKAYVVENNPKHNTEYNWNSEGGQQNQIWGVSHRGAPVHRGAARGRGRAGRYQIPARFHATPRLSPARRDQLFNRQVPYVNNNANNNSSANLSCSRCGLPHGSLRCPAIGRRCLKCNSYDHFSRMCNVHEVRAEENNDQGGDSS
ncbi:uncharacterized protein LOC134749201 [Cydia strobilella]|uniref:uncharacterized protein LOC134747706 n=1 Tax=Cydia strobilella TaxID=1100964 RepID=UPI003005B0C0